MRMQPKVMLDREVEGLLDPRPRRRLAVDVEFADAAVIAAPVFGLNQLPDRRIVEPGLDVRAGAIGTDERHDPQARRFRVDELMRALVRTAGRQDARDVVAA